MPHLRIEYAMADPPDMGAFCAVMRDAMAETAVFPLGGVRVRAFRAEAAAIADGDAGGYGFLDMTLRMGQGREAAARAAVADRLYAAAEEWLKPRVGVPFALSLEVLEIDARFSRKRFNTIHQRLEGRN